MTGHNKLKFRSALMTGRVWHKRFEPRVHEFNYRVFYCLLDLDELDSLEAQTRYFSVGKHNLFSIFPDDYGLEKGTRSGNGASLKKRVADTLRREFNLVEGPDRVELLTMPRVMGYAFNPISVYYCYDSANILRHVVYEVNNTFGERFSYAFAIDMDGSKTVPHACKKKLHVSPFFDVSGGYEFRQIKSQAGLNLVIDYRENGKTVVQEHAPDKPGKKTFIASITLKNKDFTSKNLLFNAARIPFVTLKVIGAIHWQALRLWLKRHRVFTKPAAPETLCLSTDQSTEGQ